MLLAGDIGGTKTILAIYSEESGARQAMVEKTYPSAAYGSLEKIIAEFLTSTDLPVDRACFGLAGPVVNQASRITNLPWVITNKRLQEALGISSVALLNDLQAIAFAVPHLQPDEVHTLHAGDPLPGGNIAVIAPGTGLGEAYLTWDGQRYHAYPSEGGHGDFAPTSPIEIEMLRYLMDRLDHVSYERLASGSGFPNIYNFLRDAGYAQEPAWLTEQLRQSHDPSPIIVSAGMAGDPPCELCTMAVDLFVSILGAETGNLALKLIARGGVYLGGGIPPRILPALEQQRFMRSFLHKGRMADLLLSMPVKVILNPRMALLGVAFYGLEQLSPAV